MKVDLPNISPLHKFQLGDILRASTRKEIRQKHVNETTLIDNAMKVIYEDISKVNIDTSLTLEQKIKLLNRILQ